MDQWVVNKNIFGHDGFRPGQEALIDAILSGRDCLGVMPTGGGKSLCYQIPALMLPGLTLVISPLISLMKDQVAALGALGVPAAFWNSALSAAQRQSVRQGVERGDYKLLYIAPERLDSPEFTQLMARCPVSLAAVDEAHCVSQWGQDFRPSYLKIADFIDALPARPVVAAFTATATPAVREDIVRLLRLRDPQTQVTGFDRPNLFFDVLRPKSKKSAVKELIRERAGRSGIVYCATRRAVEAVCELLRDAGVDATMYHAGLDAKERRENQEDFQFDRKSVMVATNAFGMGIDKSNVSYVIHYNMPKSLEAYYQEAGRAGRDGEPADCILLFGNQDVMTARFLIDHREEREELTVAELEALRQQDYRRLDAMVGYCKTGRCYRAYILDYFGQAHGEGCENCGNCGMEYARQDITVPAQMILSCIRRVRDHLGYYVGPVLIVRILRGSRDQRVLELGLDGLSTYGLMNRLSRQTVNAMVDSLERQGYVERESEHGTLRPTGQASAVLFHGQRVDMQVKRFTQVEQAPRPRRADVSLGERQELYDRLSALRLQLARQASVPAYVVFSNATLRDMAQKAPATPDDFLEVSGVGETKAARYGAAFLEEIRRWRKER